MIIRRLRGLSVAMLLLQSGAAFGLFWLWRFIFFTITNEKCPDGYLLPSIVISLAFLGDMVRSEFGKRSLLDMSVGALQQLSIRQVITAACVLFAYQVAAHDLVISRLFLATFLLLLYFQTLWLYLHAPGWLVSWLFPAHRSHNTLIVGPAASLPSLDEWIARRRLFGLKVVGVLSDAEPEGCFKEIPHLGEIEHLDAALQLVRIENVLVTGADFSTTQLSNLAQTAERHGARLLLHHDLSKRLNRRLEFLVDEGHTFVTMRQEPLECPINRVTKRIFDVAVSLPIVLFVLPVLSVIVWILHRLQSPGPLFYRQNRTGLVGERFCILKFRSMHVNGTAAVQAKEGDERIFAAGRWLRKLSLDEMPQFINVLIGDMSVVGPRPHLPEHEPLFAASAELYHMRRFVKPGITGLAQVNGFRGETSTREDVSHRINADLQYMENWSLGMDAMLTLRTIAQMFRPPKSAV
jgi:exopolysaccharide biosynthesis polyprenyl glycosylphosphotransferase